MIGNPMRWDYVTRFEDADGKALDPAQANGRYVVRTRVEADEGSRVCTFVLVVTP